MTFNGLILEYMNQLQESIMDNERFDHWKESAFKDLLEELRIELKKLTINNNYSFLRRKKIIDGSMRALFNFWAHLNFYKHPVKNRLSIPLNYDYTKRNSKARRKYTIMPIIPNINEDFAKKTESVFQDPI